MITSHIWQINALIPVNRGAKPSDPYWLQKGRFGNDYRNIYVQELSGVYEKTVEISFWKLQMETYYYAEIWAPFTNMV